MVARSAEIEDEIVRRLSDGEPLRSICRDNHMPGWQRVYEWMAADSDFAGRIARGRENSWGGIGWGLCSAVFF